MLPGIRFIFVTVILSASVLIFGLSAAALLRVSHEEFATLPSWRMAQPQFPPAPVETTMPTLAMLRIDTPETVKADVAEESSDLTPAPSSDADLNKPDRSDKPSASLETPAQPEALEASAEYEASAEKSADIGNQPAPTPADSPAPNVIATAPTPVTEKQDGAKDKTDFDSKTFEAVAPEAQTGQTDAAEAKPEKAETADIEVAGIKASQPKPQETPVADVSVTAAITAETKGPEIKLRTVKVHATKPKPVAKKAKRSGIYALAQRRRAAARARAIARARAARIAQQKFVAVDPFTALFGVPAQPSQIVQTTPHQ